jgi:hypothetical protein
MLISKINFKNLKNIILKYFKIKNILKSIHYYIIKNYIIIHSSMRKEHTVTGQIKGIRFD